MFCKLLKYDIKDIAKNMLSMYLIILLLGVFTKIFDVMSRNFSVFDYLKTGTEIILVIACIAGITYCFFIGFRNFYQKVLKDEGYLTNTLPVKKYQIILSKAISFNLMITITIIVVIIGLIIAFYTDGVFQTIWDIVKITVESMGYNIYVMLGFIIAIFLLSNITLINTFYCALSVGHGFSRNKLTYSLIIGVIIYFIYEILNVIGLIFLFVGNPDMFSQLEQDIPPENIFIQVFSISLTTMLILSTVTYFVTNHSLKNRLNLE